ncbi:hypothetical protein [Palleronia abyssalis]|uniref:Uncharacterized protein n=1 Tax=Palleronia abyssalis TaxID=1501240 RepID=A0A2R8BS32_9RHOB|nr:hypothetical protein [Palleronia abyssalis]SPJ22905.1 hypothetical protein PAA8504_00704 [Palleronia abyssalis]
MKNIFLPQSVRNFLKTPAGHLMIELSLWVPMVAFVAGIATVA